jgi:hypothetical protein
VARSPYHVLYGRVRNRINSKILINYTNELMDELLCACAGLRWWMGKEAVN